MSLRKLPEAKTFQRPQNFQWDAPSDVLAKWAEHPLAAESDDPNTISIYDVIGEDMWTGAGFTAKRMGAALRSIGKNPVTVKINSPGGDMFEGIAIYNLLREHSAKVTVDVMGWAASAASIIAMAGDDIRMGLGTFMMVHNAWGIVIGNRHDMREAAKLFDGFDAAIVDIYEARAKIDRKAIEKLMDAETFMGPSEAVEKGFADLIAEDLKASDGDAKNSDRRLMARRQTEAALARSGFSRNMRSEMISELMNSAARDAGRTPATERDAGRTPATERDAGRPHAARDAGITTAAVQGLMNALKI
jgi:ATP-dependent protease ClpP protease subunit